MFLQLYIIPDYLPPSKWRPEVQGVHRFVYLVYEQVITEINLKRWNLQICFPKIFQNQWRLAMIAMSNKQHLQHLVIPSQLLGKFSHFLTTILGCWAPRRHGLRNQKLEQKKIAFSENLVLSSTSLYKFLHKKSKYLVEGIKSYTVYT